MYKQSDLQKLRDTLRRICVIEELCKKSGGVCEALFDADLTQPAIMMHLIVCNENIDKLMYSDIDLREIFSQQELRGIRAIRNIAAHDYDGLDFGIMQNIVEFHLPLMREKIENFLAKI